MNEVLTELSLNHDDFMELAMSLTKKNLHKSQDAVSEMYLLMAERLARTDLKPIKKPLDYAYIIVRNMIFKGNKKISTTLYAEELEGFEFESDDNKNQKLETFKKFLNQVPYLDREVLLQHQEKTQRQIQKDTGVCRDRLRVYKNRGLKRLNEIIEEDRLKKEKLKNLQNAQTTN
ncbi:hypothetical protein [Maribacter sp. 2210JD10-5]|uniref:hypothetical protein n=1 Tax=Maribacter sp. 2210JD10-5 TaxID=3386272 RepID=UPI0039BD7E0C